MIKKLHEEWEKVSEETRQVADQDPQRHQEILERMSAVGGALRKLSQGSVTRMTLSQAVREALAEILKNEKDRFFPDLADAEAERAALREGLEGSLATRAERLEARLRGIEGQVEGLETELSGLRERGERVEAELSALRSLAGDLERNLAADLKNELSARLDRAEALRRDLESADDHLAEGLKELEGRLAGRTADLESTTASRLDGLEGSLRQSLAAAETRLVEAQGQLEARFTSSVQAMASRIGREQAERILKIEAALPEVRALEERLRSQMRIVMEQLDDKVDGLVSMVSQVKAGLPPRELFQALDERLMRIESRFRTVSDQLDALEGAMAEGKGLAEQVSQVRGEVVGLATEFSTSEKGLRDAWDLFARRLQDLQDLLRTGVDRWEADRSGLRQRLVDLRDTLRDGLQSAAQRAEGTPGSFWGKMLARPDGGLRLGSEDWDRLRTRLESILQGLEGLLVESR